MLKLEEDVVIHEALLELKVHVVEMEVTTHFTS